MPARRFLVLALFTLAAPAAAQPKADAPADRVPGPVPEWKVSTLGFGADESAFLDGPANELGANYVAERKKQIGAVKAWVTELYEAAVMERKGAGRPLIPPFIPTAADDLIIYHNNRGLIARPLRPHAAYGERYRPGEVFWEQEQANSLFSMADRSSRRATLDQWRTAHGKESTSELVWSRTLSHALTAGAQAVYSVDEAAFQPMRVKPDERGHASRHYLLFQANLHHPVLQTNHLQRVAVDTGKSTARLGEFPGDKAFRTYRFLSPPATSSGTILFLWERQRTLRVSRLDLGRFNAVTFVDGRQVDATTHAEALTRVAHWETDLLVARESVVTDVHRRIHAIHLTEVRDLVICPTHLGCIFGIDTLNGEIRWTHEYAPLTAKRFPTFAPEWVVVPPVVADGKYVYAPADFPELLCLNVADGQKVWSAKKGDGLYPAVVGDLVLVVGEKTVRALRLKDGTEVWKFDLPGLPCGRGAVLGDDYLVPVSEPKTWKGLVAVVDLKAGKVREVLKPEKDEPVGNLVVHQDS